MNAPSNMARQYVAKADKNKIGNWKFHNTLTSLTYCFWKSTNETAKEKGSL